jgi:hypothetical protein
MTVDSIEFPVCGYAGRELTPEKRFCRHPQVGRGLAVSCHQCAACHVPAMMMDTPPATTNNTLNEGTCQHRGAELRQVDAATCCGSNLVVVSACKLYGECTQQQRVGLLPTCETCSDFIPLVT